MPSTIILFFVFYSDERFHNLYNEGGRRMITRDPKQPVVIDLEEGDSVALIPWEYVVDKMDDVLGVHVNPDLRNINDSITRIRDVVKRWVEEQEGGNSNE